MQSTHDLFTRGQTIGAALGDVRKRMLELGAEREKLSAFLRVFDAGVPSKAYRGNAPPDPEQLRATLARTSTQLSKLRAQEAELMVEEHGVHRALERHGMRRQLPVIGTITIAAPCPASWADMTGDERVRMCKMCKQNVFNLSEMTTEDGARLLQETQGRVCVRFFQRSDGTVMTADCPEGIARRNRRNAIGGAMIAVSAAFGAWAVKELLTEAPCEVQQAATQGFGGGGPLPNANNR